MPEQSNRSGDNRVVPDGTLFDQHNLHRGYWEAKDTNDRLDDEIAKKNKKGYPLSNIIFEDSSSAWLLSLVAADLVRVRPVAESVHRSDRFGESLRWMT